MGPGLSFLAFHDAAATGKAPLSVKISIASFLGYAVIYSPILVVEDDADVRSLLFETLTEVGGFLVYAVATAGAAQALMAECGGSFAAAVLDVGLPDGDGRDFCASLRRQGFHLPVILLSGLGGEDDIVAGFEAGADDYLVKPFGMVELLARLAAQLRRTAPQARPMPACREPAA